MKNKTSKYVITDACIVCKNCKNKCPKKAIYFSKEKFRCEINNDLCISCGLCFKNCVYRAINKIDNK